MKTVFGKLVPRSIQLRTVRRTLPHMIELAEPLEFFVQLVHSGVVAIDGDQATARWSVQETGRTRTKGPYNNYAFYEDQLVKREGAWRFARRSYRYVWLDLKSPIGGEIIR
jgi:hypothetical protein